MSKLNAAITAFEHHSLDETIRLLKEHIAECPGDWRAYLYLGMSWARKGQTKLAFDYVRQARDSCDDLRVVSQLADCAEMLQSFLPQGAQAQQQPAPPAAKPNTAISDQLTPDKLSTCSPKAFLSGEKNSTGSLGKIWAHKIQKTPQAPKWATIWCN